MKYTIGFFFLLLTIGLTAQKPIGLDDIWLKYTFVAESVPGFNFQNDGKHYTRLENNKIEQYDLTTGERTETVLDGATLGKVKGYAGTIEDYYFSADEKKIVISAGTEKLYRHSTKAYYLVYDRAAKTLMPVYPDGKHRLASLNKQGDKVAFVFENNLYYHDLATGKLTQITTDGAANAIINGATDWVYEEEFSFDRGFEWSPDGQRIAYYRFDERAVPEFTMTNYKGELYPEYETFKYPKVGSVNSQVSIQVYDVASQKSTTVQTGDWEYIPRIKWTQSADQLCVFRMNRHQNELELLLADAQTGATKRLLYEKDKYYIDIDDDLTFLEDGKQFVWSSDRDGFNHLYLYTMDGQLVQQLTQGDWPVTSFYGVDEANGRIYFEAAMQSPLRREIYTKSLRGKDKARPLSSESGWNTATFSSTFDYFVLEHSTINTPPVYSVMNPEGNRLRVIEDNATLVSKASSYQPQPATFCTFKTSEGVELNGYRIEPANKVKGQAYPLFMFVYGGPGSQQVVDNWRGQNYWWFQMLSQQGYTVVCVDNRGTGARGAEFQKMTYLQLGKYETKDQIEAATYLGKQPDIDARRIGIFGWSYGGYMSSLCILKGNEVFKAAIAVAPVTNWRWYDTIYTERYMRTVEENEEGYRQNSPVYFADQLKGDYLLVHGMSDDNVHFQHTAEMANNLIMANEQFDTYFYPNRNHGISGGPTRYHLYRKMTDFLEEKLKGPTAKYGPVVPKQPTIKKGGKKE